jgi:hypothetical protein
MVNSQFGVSTDYGFKNAGNDTITDFTLGKTTTNTNADILNLSDLLICPCPANKGRVLMLVNWGLCIYESNSPLIFFEINFGWRFK